MQFLAMALDLYIGDTVAFTIVYCITSERLDKQTLEIPLTGLKLYGSAFIVYAQESQRCMIRVNKLERMI